MEYVIVSIYDRQIRAYMRPFQAPTKGAATRAFVDAVNDQESPMFKHPEDYELHVLATWDDATGVYENKYSTEATANSSHREVLALGHNVKQ